MGEKEYGLFDNSHIGFQNKFLFKIRLNILKKVFFFSGFKRDTLELILFLLDVMLHFVTKLS